MNYIASQLSLLLIPGFAARIAATTLLGRGVLRRKDTTRSSRWLRLTSNILNTMGWIGVVAVLFGPEFLLILLPILSCLVSVWMIRRRAVQLRFAWGAILTKQSGLEFETLARSICETGPKLTRRQLRKAVRMIAEGKSASAAAAVANIPLPLELSLALLDESQAPIRRERRLESFEESSKIKQRYQEFVRTCNYFLAIVFVLTQFTFAIWKLVNQTFEKLQIEMARDVSTKQSLPAFVSPTSYLNSIEDQPLLAIFVLLGGFVLAISVFVVAMLFNLDQLELWPRNWWPTSRLHFGRHRATTLEHVADEVASGRSWHAVFRELAKAHPITALKKQCKSLAVESGSHDIDRCLLDKRWISRVEADAIAVAAMPAKTTAECLRLVARSQQQAIADRWARATSIVRCVGTIFCGFYVGWYALWFFGSLINVMRVWG